MMWFKVLWASRKFRVAIVDMVLALLIFILGTLLTDIQAEFWLTIIGIMQPMFVMVVVGIAWEDAAAKRSGTFYVPPDPH
ncbi:hypothetical protein LCGC14_1603550 [marine sediment metagenome]|uniref:RDD domain-containing protein n=1 Tax=marine sediment metagenome TaxID=412755 RepID=A0A0F9KR81_9ZZZZ